MGVVSHYVPLKETHQDLATNVHHTGSYYLDIERNSQYFVFSLEDYDAAIFECDGVIGWFH